MTKQLNLYRIFLLFLFIMSIHPWFLWGMATQYITVIGALYSIILLTKGKILCLEKRMASSIIAFFFLYIWMAKYFNVFGYIESIANWIILVGIIALKEQYKISLFQFITKWFSLLLLVSLLFYFFYIVGVALPHTSMTAGLYDTSISNYYAFVVIDGSYRFQSIFREPGYLTMGVAPLLFLNKYDFKNKYVLIMFIAQLFSFSLAGYLIMVVGYIFIVVFSNITNKIRRITIPLLVFSGFMYATIEIFGENLFQDLILSRLELENGMISGNNRSSDYLDFRFEQTLKSSDIFFTGSEYNRDLSEKGVAGFKLYFVMYGLFGIIILCWAYLKTFFSSTNTRTNISYGFLVIIFLLLYQNAYPTMWAVLIALITTPVVLGACRK